MLRIETLFGKQWQVLAVRESTQLFATSRLNSQLRWGLSMRTSTVAVNRLQLKRRSARLPLKAPVRLAGQDHQRGAFTLLPARATGLNRHCRGAIKEKEEDQLVGIAPVSPIEDFSLIFTAPNGHDVQMFIVRRERPSPAFPPKTADRTHPGHRSTQRRWLIPDFRSGHLYGTDHRNTLQKHRTD